MATSVISLTAVSSAGNTERNNLSLADSTPRRTQNPNSKPIDAEHTETGLAGKAFADRKPMERVTETTKDLPADSKRDIINRLTVVFIHDRIVRKAQLPCPHATSHEIQKILNKINLQEFKFSRLEESLIKIADLMEAQQGPAIEQLVARLPTTDDLPSTLTGIAREVFFANVSDGVFWARLVAVFAFAGRVAVQCVKTEAGSYVTAIAVCLQKLILDHLYSDIERLGGWDAFVAYCDRADQRRLDMSPALGGGLRRFFMRLVTVASKGTGDLDSEVDGPASPQPLTSKVGWFAAPIALGASALYDVIAGDHGF